MFFFLLYPTSPVRPYVINLIRGSDSWRHWLQAKDDEMR